MAMGSSLSMLHGIEKLKGPENYHSWSVDMSAYLKHEGLWKVVKEETTSEERNDKAYGKIILSCERAPKSEIEKCTSAKAAWDKLHKIYAHTGWGRLSRLLRNAVNVKLSECEDARDYISKVQTAFYELIDTKVKLEDDVILGAILLNGLTSDFNPLLVSIESQKDATIDSSYIKTKIVEAAENLSSIGEEPEGVQNRASSLYSSGRARNFRRGGRPNFRGNFQQSQRGSYRQQQGQQQGQQQIRCFNCNRLGHKSFQCPNPRRERGQGQNSANMAEGQEENFCLSPQPQGVTHAAFLTVSENVLSVATGNSQPLWILDSGASRHMSNNKNNFVNMRNSNLAYITAANKGTMDVCGEGDIRMRAANNTEIILRNVLFIPDLGINLMSISCIVNNCNSVNFVNNSCCIYNKSKFLVLKGTLLKNGIYRADVSVIRNFEVQSAVQHQHQVVLSAATDADLECWHRRMGHLNVQYLKRLLLNNGIIVKKNGNQSIHCKECVFGKMIKRPFKINCKRASERLQLVHTDLCYVRNAPQGKAKYFLTLLDDYSRKCFVYILRSKTDVFDALKMFIQFAENQTNCRIKIIRSDNGTEYINQKVQDYLKEKGIGHQTTVPDNPQSNGRAERLNRTLIEKARTMINEAGLDYNYWEDAICTAAYLANRSPKSVLNMCTPEELWTGKKVNLLHIKPFGCKVLAYIPRQFRNEKFSPTAKEALLLGYEESKYRLLDLKTRAKFTSRDVKFYEDEFPLKPKTKFVYMPFNEEQDVEEEKIEENLEDSINKEEKEEIIDQDLYEDKNSTVNEEIIEPSTSSRPTRTKRKPVTLKDYVTPTISYYCTDDKLEVPTPKNYKEAIECAHKAQWLEAMEKEYKAIVSNKTWELCDPPAGCNIIGSKWVYKWKTEADETFAKARLVAQGYSQIEGIDYYDTYAPVVNLITLRLLFSIAAKYDFDILHWDVNSAFLQGELDEVIYLKQPDGFITDDTKVCKLNKSIYGLKQSSHVWNKKLDVALKNINLYQCHEDKCVYMGRSEGKIIFISIFVDDILVFSESNKVTDLIRQQLFSKFSIKDLGEVKKCIGINVIRDRVNKTVQLNQSDYILSIINKYESININSVSIPMQPSYLKDLKEYKDDLCSENLPYRNLVGAIMHVYRVTRPDLGFAICSLSRYNNCYHLEHFKGLKTVLRYLKGSYNLNLTYCYNEKSKGPILGYSDASHKIDPRDPRPVIGFTFIYNGGAFSWNCTRVNQYVAGSSSDAEYQALVSAVKEGIWTRRLAIEFFVHQEENPLTIFCDNTNTIKLGKEGNASSQTKYIQHFNHFIKQQVDNSFINVEFISGEEMIADGLTKPLPSVKFKKFVEDIGLLSAKTNK